MEVVTGALPRLLPKLGELLLSECNLQKEVKGGIKFLQVELEHMKAALEKISSKPADQLDKQDKIWARDVRDLSYDIEDKVDTFMLCCKGSNPGEQLGFKKAIDRSLDLLMQPKIRRKISTDIRDLKIRVEEVGKRRDRYKVTNSDITKPVIIDPRLFSRYEKVAELVGIDEARDEVIKILGEDDKVSNKLQEKRVSIVGFGGLGKTTLANVIYEKLREKFSCSAFVFVSQTPDMDKLFKDMFYQLTERSNGSVNIIDELRGFLETKRYLVVIDDIWDISVWKMIKCALPDNNVACKIITTTRILNIAEQAGVAYRLKPLSLQNSRKLLYGRIFGNQYREHNGVEEKCLNEELTEVSNRILKKCAGVPLAIITIASILANKGRNKMEWYEVYKSIGIGMENNLDAENMRKILSYSYYDLPPHLKTCLLYVSIFPEDFEIDKHRLIWLWIAEGFIQCNEQEKSIFELGESYFNDLINRCMIQPVYAYFGIKIQCCRIHDMVLELIRSLAGEENFITILSDMVHKSASTKIRKLSLQNEKVNSAMSQAIRIIPQVRSVLAFPSAFDQMPALRRFKVLRVLDLRGCDLSRGYSLKYLGNLCYLRYLGLRGTRIEQLPEKVGNLQFLETLDVEQTKISCLPSTVAQLKHLLCLSVGWNTRLPNIIGGLASLEELSWLRIDDESIDTIEELGLLTRLRVLHIALFIDKWNGKLVESLCKLLKIHSLRIVYFLSNERDKGGLDAWEAPRQLRRLDIRSVCWFSALPTWMNNPSHLLDLSILSIAVRALPQEDLEILGRLPVLRFLDLEVHKEDLSILGRFVVGAGSFPCLVRCELWGLVRPVVFQRGAMLQLRWLKIEFCGRVAREIVDNDGDFYSGLVNLPSLQYIDMFRSGSASKEEVEEAKVLMRLAADIHPNQPTLRIY